MVVQTAIPADVTVEEIKSWVTESYGVIKNKKLKRQVFEMRDQDGKMVPPYRDSMDIVHVFDAIKDQNALSLVFNFPRRAAQTVSKSTFLIGELMTHEVKGGLYHLLRSRGLIEKIYTDDFTSFQTISHQFMIDIRLTNEGLKRWAEVTALVFCFLKSVLAKFEASGLEGFKLFDEVV